MKTLTEVAHLFAKLDKIPQDQIPTLDKALRNLTQRVFIHPDSQSGRAFLYMDHSIGLIRLVHVASICGLDRVYMERMKTWLVEKGRIREAYELAKAGEEFRLHVIIAADGLVTCRFDYSPETSGRAKATLDLTHGPLVELGRFTLPASTLLAAIEG